jgi:ribosomal protein L11
MNFVVDLPSISYFLNLLKFESVVKVRLHDRYHDKLISCVKLYSVLQLARLKFPNKALPLAFKIIMGTVYSMNLTITR